MGCLTGFFGVMILFDVFDHHTWHGREWAEFALGLLLLFGGFIFDYFEGD